MGGRKNHLAVKADAPGNFRAQISQNRAGGFDLAEDLAGQTQPLDELFIPGLAPGPYQGGGGGVGILIGHYAGETVVQIIRDHQKMFRCGQLVRMLLLERAELVNGVERLVLDAGVGIELCKGQYRFQFISHGGGAVVPIGNRITDDIPLSVQQQKIHRPGIDSHGSGGKPCIMGGFQALNHTLNQIFHIPAQVPVLFNQPVLKTVDLMQSHTAIPDCTNHMAPAGCANIHGKITGLHLSLLFDTIILEFVAFGFASLIPSIPARQSGFHGLN